jgi:flavin-binding protein dodecin
MMARLLLLSVCAAALGGCGSVLTATTADVSGIASAGIASAVTKSPTAAAGIGLGVAAGANAGLQYAERTVHSAEQDRIAEAAGGLDPGAVGHWKVSHTIPIEDDEHGDLVVTRLIGSSDFNCKEIVFSVDTTEDKAVKRAFYTATVCQDGAVWKWASAEPATARWGALQ